MREGNLQFPVSGVIHKENGMLKYPEKFREGLLTDGVNLSEPERIKISNIDIVKFVRTYENGIKTTFYYFNYNEDFDYEVEIFDGEECVGEYMNILLNATYDYDSEEKYPYHYADYTEKAE